MIFVIGMSGNTSEDHITQNKRLAGSAQLEIGQIREVEEVEYEH